MTRRGPRSVAPGPRHPLLRYGAALRLRGVGAAGRRRACGMSTRRPPGLSTKVGRLVRSPTRSAPTTSATTRLPVAATTPSTVIPGPERIVFDYSSDGVRRSIEESLSGLGLERIDIALIHDPDDHWQAAIDGAYPALARLREQGMIRGDRGRHEPVGDAHPLRPGDRHGRRPSRRALHAPRTGRPRRAAGLRGGAASRAYRRGREQRAARRSAVRKPVNYTPAPAEVVERARRIGEVCERHHVPLRAAAIQFPLAHAVVAPLVVGVRTVGHLDEYPAFARLEIPGRYGTTFAPGPAPAGCANDAAGMSRMIIDAHHHFWDPAPPTTRG